MSSTNIIKVINIFVNKSKMHQGEYIKQLLKQRKITQEELGERVGTSRAQVVKLLKNIVIEEDTLGTMKKIMDYLELKQSDLPVVTEEELVKIAIKNVSYKRGGSTISYTRGKEAVETSDSIKQPRLSTEGKGVPYYDVDFIGGFDLVLNSQTVRPSYYIDFLPFNDVDCWLNVTGKSMGPLIAHGDIVALKKLHDWRNFLLLGEIYAIVTPEFRTIKIIGKGDDDDHFTLIPYNKDNGYATQPVPKNIITHMFRVKGALKKFF